MAQQQGTQRPEQHVVPGPVLADGYPGPASSPFPPPPSAAEEPPAHTRIGPKPRFPSFVSMLRAQPLRTLRWVMWGGGGQHAEFFRGPVRWLFGRDLITNLRSIAVYGAFGAELDHRDWMTATPIDFSHERCEEGGFWFDYLADSGDGQLAMYDLACLLLGDLFVDEAVAGAAVSVNDGAQRLPRGRFLFMGGDTAYHVADDATIEERLCTPFEWALAERGLGEWARKTETEPLAHYVFGIPGNHDYYDSLIGFNRLFRAPDNPRLAIADWQRVQSASFVALQLPFDFWFIGLDSQHGKIDRRQREFVGELLAKHGSSRLIVATPEPATVFDAVRPEAAKPYAALELPRPFSAAPSFPLASEIQLDLAGDVHHYARYCDETKPNYAYVVSGGGGAFVHPTHTSHATPNAAWPPSAAKYYPDRLSSRCEITRRLLCPWRIFRGGGVLVIGGLAAVLLYFGAALGPGTHALFTSEAVPGLWIDSPVVYSVDRVVTSESAWRPDRATLLWSEWVSLALVLAVVAGGFASRRLFARAGDPDPASRPIVRARRYGFLIVLAGLSLGCMALMHWQRSVSLEVAMVTPLLANVLLAIYLAPLPLSVLWIIGYLATQPKQAKVRRLTGADSLPRWAALVFGVATSVFGLLAYGVNSVAAFMSDLGALAAFAVLGLGPMIAAALQGARRPLRAKVGYVLLGLWFGLLQLAVPLSFAVQGTWLSFFACTAWALALAWLALPIQRRWSSPWLLLALWLLAGAGVIALAVVLGELAPVSIARFFVAFAAGGFFSCVWFGWYLAVSLGWGAHNNEAGGAARLDAFRHFIRFKLERDRLTGYVIGFDWPCADVGLGQASVRALEARKHGAPTLRVKLIDRFELTPKRDP